MKNCTGKRCLLQQGTVDPATCKWASECPTATPLLDNDLMQRMAKEVIDSLPEDSPLRPLIKDKGDAALVYILMALFFLPNEEMKRIVQEMLEEAET